MLLTEEKKSAVIAWLLNSKYNKIPFELAVFFLAVGSSHFFRINGHDLISLAALLIGAVVVVCIAAGDYSWLLFFPFMALSGSVSSVPSIPPVQPMLVLRNPNQRFQAIDKAQAKFKDRIKDPVQVQKNVAELQTAYTSATAVENDSKANHIGEAGLFIVELYQEITSVISDPEKLAPILAEVCFVGPAATLGYCLAKFMIRKLREKLSRKPNPCIACIVDDLQCLLAFFDTVPESRLAEIVSATKLPKEKVQSLLKIGPFENRGQFWHLTTETNTSIGAPANGELGIKLSS